MVQRLSGPGLAHTFSGEPAEKEGQPFPLTSACQGQNTVSYVMCEISATIIWISSCVAQQPCRL